IGQTNRFAWTTTSGEIDNSTLYVETLEAPVFPEPQSDSATYAFLFEGTYQPMDRRVEIFHYAGEDSSKPPAYAPSGPALTAGARPVLPPGFDDRLPADGTGSQEWGTFPDGSRYVPFSRSLLSVNPTQGYLVNWNTKPADKPYIQEGNSHDEHWGEIYRSDRMAFLRANDSHVNLKDAEELERDAGTMHGTTETVCG